MRHGRLLIPYVRAGLDVDGCDVSADMIALCREKAEREGLSPTLFAQSMDELDPPRTYKTIFVCGGFGLGSSREQDVEALGRFYENLEPGGTLVLDNENPYSLGYPWASWRKDERAALPRSRQPLDEAERRHGSDDAEYALESRLLDLDPRGAIRDLRDARRDVAERRARARRGARVADQLLLQERAPNDARTRGLH